MDFIQSVWPEREKRNKVEKKNLYLSLSLFSLSFIADKSFGCSILIHLHVGLHVSSLGLYSISKGKDKVQHVHIQIKIHFNINQGDSFFTNQTKLYTIDKPEKENR